MGGRAMRMAARWGETRAGRRGEAVAHPAPQLSEEAPGLCLDPEGTCLALPIASTTDVPLESQGPLGRMLGMEAGLAHSRWHAPAHGQGP